MQLTRAVIRAALRYSPPVGVCQDVTLRLSSSIIERKSDAHLACSPNPYQLDPSAMMKRQSCTVGGTLASAPTHPRRRVSMAANVSRVTRVGTTR